MPNFYEDVDRFQTEILGIEKPTSPTLVSQTFAMERFRFLDEEAMEYFDAALMGDLVGAIDGLIDIVYVALGTLLQMGVPIQACWDAVQTANMAKVKGITSRGNEIDAVKPEGWVGPETRIAAIIGESITEAQYKEDNA
jgi:predicted HAD superfamily Cof-like phosphohydrolase